MWPFNFLKKKKKIQPTPNSLHNRMNTHYRNTVTGNVGNANDGFINSVIIGAITDDAATGMLFGGNAAGAIIGDAINTSDEQNDDKYGGQGGKFGGGGAGESFANDEPTEERESDPEPDNDSYEDNSSSDDCSSDD